MTRKIKKQADIPFRISLQLFFPPSLPLLLPSPLLLLPLFSPLFPSLPLLLQILLWGEHALSCQQLYWSLPYPIKLLLSWLQCLQFSFIPESLQFQYFGSSHIMNECWSSAEMVSTKQYQQDCNNYRQENNMSWYKALTKAQKYYYKLHTWSLRNNL